MGSRRIGLIGMQARLDLPKGMAAGLFQALSDLDCETESAKLLIRLMLKFMRPAGKFNNQ